MSIEHTTYVLTLIPIYIWRCKIHSSGGKNDRGEVLEIISKSTRTEMMGVSRISVRHGKEMCMHLSQRNFSCQILRAWWSFNCGQIVLQFEQIFLFQITMVGCKAASASGLQIAPNYNCRLCLVGYDTLRYTV